MKPLIAFFLLMVSFSSMACSCSYDYGSRSRDFMARMGTLLGADSKTIKVLEHEVHNTVRSYTDPDFYSARSCGCTQYVKRVWRISYQKGQELCEAKAVLQVWNDKMKVRTQGCQL